MKKSILIAPLAVLAFGFWYWQSSGKAKKLDQTRANLQAVTESLQQFKLHNYNYPTNEQGLQALYAAPSGVRMWRGPYAQAEQAKDAWGQDFVYETTDSYGFRLISKGPDGQAGTSDDMVSTNTPNK